MIQVGGSTGRLVCCDPCALALSRGRRRPGWPRPSTASFVLAGTTSWTVDVVEVLRADTEPGPESPGVCPLCSATRLLRQRGTAQLADVERIPNGVGDPPRYPADVTAIGVGDFGPVTAEEAVEEVRVTIDQQLAAGAPYQGVRLPSGPSSRGAWLYLRAEAANVEAAVQASGAPLSSPVVGGGRLPLWTAEDVLAAVKAVGSYSMALEGSLVDASELAAAIPTALDLVLEALRSDNPPAGLAAIAALAETVADDDDPPEERAAAAAALGLGGTP